MFCRSQHTGFLTGISGLGTTLTARLAPYMLGNQENAQMNDVQPVQARTVRVPDYFAEFRERGDGLAAFLGASIIAKVSILSVSRPRIHPLTHWRRSPSMTERTL